MKERVLFRQWKQSYTLQIQMFWFSGKEEESNQVRTSNCEDQRVYSLLRGTREGIVSDPLVVVLLFIDLAFHT